jgi:fatty-acyl-CoA synthase
MNICRWIEWWAERTPNKTALRFEGASISYREFLADIKSTADALQRLGVTSGDRVAWLAYNGPAFLTMFFACASIGAIIVPLNFRLTPREHLFAIRDAGATNLFFDVRLSATAELIADQYKSCKLISISEQVHAPATLSLRAMMGEADGLVHENAAHWDDPVLIVYTSGTTGRPKGAVLTQRAIHWNALNSQQMHDLHRDDHVLTTLPFFHVGGLNIQTTPALQAGATVTLIEKFHAGQFLTFVENERPTLTVLVPTQMQAIAAHPRWQDTDLSSLRCVTTGSTMVQEPLLNIWHDHDIPVVQIYGATETGPIAIHQVIETAHTTVGSVGRPALYCDIRIVDENDVDVPDDTAGEILVRGPNVLSEYWNNPEATAKALQNGWLRTGDVGKRDAQGNYYVVDRKTRVIISGGENIYPSELERILNEHPSIKEVVVVGLADDTWGEVPAAAIVCNGAEKLDAATLAGLFEGRLGHMKHPRHFVTLGALPRNAMGKVVLADVAAEIVNSLSGQAGS